MFWELELHIKNIQQYTILFAFFKSQYISLKYDLSYLQF